MGIALYRWGVMANLAGILDCQSPDALTNHEVLQISDNVACTLNKL